MAASLASAAGSVLASLAEPFIPPNLSTPTPASTAPPATTSTPVIGRLDLGTKTLNIPFEWNQGDTTTIPLTYPVAPAAPVTTPPADTGKTAYSLSVELYPGSTTLLRVTLPTWADIPATHTTDHFIVTASFNIPSAPTPTVVSSASTSSAAASTSTSVPNTTANATATTNSTNTIGINTQFQAFLGLKAATRNQGLHIGLSIGGGCLACAILALLFWFLQRRKHRKKSRLSSAPIPLVNRNSANAPSLAKDQKMLSTSTTSSASYAQKPGHRNSYSIFGSDFDPTQKSRQHKHASGTVYPKKWALNGPERVRSLAQNSRRAPSPQVSSCHEFDNLEYKGGVPLISLSKAQRLDYIRRNPALWQTPVKQRRSSFAGSSIHDVAKDWGDIASNRTTFTPRLGVRNGATKPAISETVQNKGLGVSMPRPRTDSTTRFLSVPTSPPDIPEATTALPQRTKRRDKETWLALFGKYPSSDDISTIADERSDEGWKKREASTTRYPPTSYRQPPPPRNGSLTPQPLRRRRSESDWSIPATERERIIDLYAAMPRTGDGRDDLTEAEIESVRGASRDRSVAAESEIQEHAELRRYLEMAPIWG